MQVLQLNEGKELFLNMSRSSITGRAGVTEVHANTTDAAVEKHVPIATFEDGEMVVRVGSAVHPMAEPHHIEWVLVETKDGGLFHFFTPTDDPEAKFHVCRKECVAVYSYCNLHGLWKADV